MIQIPKWNKELDKLIEDYFREDEEGNSKHRRDYYSDDLPLIDINNYIVHLYHCPPKERWERVTELIPIKWYKQILNILEGQDDEDVEVLVSIELLNTVPCFEALGLLDKS